MKILVLTALVKYKNNDDISFLTSNSYIIETNEHGQANAREVGKCFMEFKDGLEESGLEIMSVTAYIVPEEQLDQVLNSEGKANLLSSFNKDGKKGKFSPFLNIFGRN